MKKGQGTVLVWGAGRKKEYFGKGLSCNYGDGGGSCLPLPKNGKKTYTPIVNTLVHLNRIDTTGNEPAVKERRRFCRPTTRAPQTTCLELSPIGAIATTPAAAAHELVRRGELADGGRTAEAVGDTSPGSL